MRRVAFFVVSAFALSITAVSAFAQVQAPRPPGPPPSLGNLSSSPQGKPVVTTGTGHRIEYIAFDPNGKWVATAGMDDSVRLWEVSTGRMLRILSGHQQFLISVAVSPDGQRVASKDSDGFLKVWNPETGQLLRTIETGRNGRVQFSRDGRTMFAELKGPTSEWGTIVRWDVETGRLVSSYHLPPDGPLGRWTMTLSPDERFLLAGDLEDNGKIWVFDVSSGRLVRSWAAHKDGVRIVEFSQDGRFVVSAGYDDTRIVKVWDASSGRLIRQFKGHTSYVSALAFSPDARVIFTGSEDKIIKAWEVGTGKVLWSQTVPVYADWMTISPDSKFLVVGMSRLEFWDMATGKAIRALRGLQNDNSSATTLVMPDKNWVSANDGGISVWDGSTGQRLRTFGPKGGGAVTSAVQTNGGQVLMPVIYGNTVRLWDVTSGQQMVSFDVPQTGNGDLRSAVISPDGRTIATASYSERDGTIKLWDAATGRMTRSIQAYQKYAIQVAFSPDGQTLVSAGRDEDNFIKFWDVASGRLIKPMPLKDPSNAIFSPDGKKLLVDNSELEHESVKILDVASGAIRGRFKHGYYTSVTAWSPDGRIVVSAGGFAKVINLWDADGGGLMTAIETNPGATDSRGSLSFSPDSRRLNAANSNGTITIWSVPSGQLITTSDQTDTGEWITMTPEGFFVASPNGADLAYLVRGMETTDLGDLKTALNRPDLVQAKLAGDPDGVVRAAAMKLDLGNGVSAVIAAPPSVQNAAPTPAVPRPPSRGGDKGMNAESAE